MKAVCVNAAWRAESVYRAGLDTACERFFFFSPANRRFLRPLPHPPPRPLVPTRSIVPNANLHPTPFSTKTLRAASMRPRVWRAVLAAALAALAVAPRVACDQRECRNV